MKSIYSSIPVELCIYGLTHQKINHLKLLVYLKCFTNGKAQISTAKRNAWACDIGVSEKWIISAIKWMIREKWITINSKKNEYRITSYFKICRRLQLTCNLAAKFEAEDFRGFRGFCCAVGLTYFLRRKKWIDRNGRSVSKMDDTSTNRNPSKKGYVTLPIRYFAKCLGVSVSSANNFKKLAESSGWIKVKPQIAKLLAHGDKPITKDGYEVFAYAEGKIVGRLRRGTKYLKIVEADLIKSSVICSKKRFKNGEKL